MAEALKLCYCLTSSGGDLYEAMTRVSLATVRLTNPEARIAIACDHLTYAALQACGSPLLHEADELHGFRTPEGPPTFRNRFVKTQLRLLLSGPFLFLDSDTVVRQPLTALLAIQADIAAARNHSADRFEAQIWTEDQANLEAMGWQVREPYVNGGVIWYGDTSGAHRFGEAWHAGWVASVAKTGRYRDQPSLNHALWTCGECALEILPHLWNAQIGFRPDLAPSARVWHLYSSTGLGGQGWFSHCCQLALAGRTRQLPARAIAGLVNATRPERVPSVVSQLASRVRAKLSRLVRR